MKIPKSHPRYNSLMQRHRIETGLERGIVARAGLIAHGRGEAFDYLIGERTQKFAKKAIEAAAAKLLLAKKPIISVNGNTTALCAPEIVELSKKIPAQIEVNLFYRTQKRIELIEKEFKKLGVKILGSNPTKKVPGLKSNRKMVQRSGMWQADVVLVMLEDGDRTELLKKMGKSVIAIDLNPLSRTARKADITIVDNITRCMVPLRKNVEKLGKKSEKQLMRIIKNYKNSKILQGAQNFIRKGAK
ncbi:MAG TPA: 4-phosphopantoate--beta-alanine ligase [archaeon]|nr:4-phosphopantoate--beta-alanine ligase [archaeon]